MKLNKNSILNLLRRWAGALLSRIRRASLSSRITGGACILTLIGYMLAPSYSKNLCLLFAGIAVLLWMASVLFHAFKRATVNGVPTRNPFTLPLIALIIVCIACFLYSRTSIGWPIYDPANEPINMLIEQLESIAADADDVQQQVDALDPWMFWQADVEHNLLVLGEDGEILSDRTGWCSSGAKKLYPLFSPSQNNSDQYLMVLVNEREQVIGTFLCEEGGMYPTDSTNQIVSINPLTLPGTDTPAVPDETTIQTTHEKLYERYFPSFGSAIDAYTMQLVHVNWMIVTDTSTPYSGELSNRQYSSKSVTFFEWNGEPIEAMRDFSASSTEEARLINALNALTDEERVELQNHVQWLYQAVQNAYYFDSLCVRLFTNVQGTQSILLLYEYSPALYPLLQDYHDQRALCDQMLVASIILILVCWILLAFWVFTDAKRRGHKHPALWGLLTMVGSVIALIVYNMVRPQMRVDRSGKHQPKGICPLCGAVLKDDYIACPGCGILLRSKCKNCQRALENDWNFCPYCTAQVIKESPEAVDDGEAITGTHSTGIEA